MILLTDTGRTCTTGDLRLQGNLREGQVEVCLNNMWGNVCSHGWNNVIAGVVCSQLGYSARG